MNSVPRASIRVRSRVCVVSQKVYSLCHNIYAKNANISVCVFVCVCIVCVAALVYRELLELLLECVVFIYLPFEVLR